MKRIVFIAILVFLATICFAKGQRESLEIGIGVPYFIENTSVEGIDVKTEMSTFAISMAGISLYTDTVGVGAYVNFMFPQKLTMSALGESISINRSAYDFLWALDMLIGPVFILWEPLKTASFNKFPSV